MPKFQGEREVSAVGRMSDPFFNSIAFVRATEGLTYEEKNTLISLILHDRKQAVSNALQQERAQNRK